MLKRASKELSISQPAVSQNIAELEKQVGAVLFDRKRGEVALTAEGYVFKDYAAKILHWYDATDALFGSAGKMTVNRPVRIATTDFVATYLLPGLLRDLLAVTATNFIINTYPETAFPESMDADLFYFTSARGDTLNFDAGSIVGTVQAALATAGPTFPEEPRYAVWAPYQPHVSQDVYARSVLVSDHLPVIMDLVRANANLVAVVPSQAAGTLTIHPDPLPHLQQDLHLRVSDAFSRSAIAQWLSSRFTE